MSVTLVTDDTFETEVLASSRPVLVDFFADWCVPCKQLALTVETFAQENAEMKVVKIDVDQSPSIAGEFGLRGVPTLMIFRGGEKLAAQTGAMSRSRLEKWVGEHIGAQAHSA